MNTISDNPAGIMPLFYKVIIYDHWDEHFSIGCHDYGHKFEVVLYKIYNENEQIWWIIGIGRLSNTDW